MTSIASRLTQVKQRIAQACAAAGRDPDEVGLVAVSKTFPAEVVEQAWAFGHRDFGENYAQELRDKGQAFESAGREIRWHYVGRVQSNKAKYIAPRAFRVHALEEVRHAEALAKRAPGPLRCLVSVDVGREKSKGGVPPERALERCRALQEVDGIEVVGLMCLPPFREDPEDVAPFFEELADLAARGRADGQPLHELSMGMSHDFPVAIRHGATWVRIGTAVFGPRD